MKEREVFLLYVELTLSLSLYSLPFPPAPEKKIMSFLPVFISSRTWKFNAELVCVYPCVPFTFSSLFLCSFSQLFQFLQYGF